MGHNARDRFMKKFTLSKYYEGLTDIFEQVLEGKMHK